jgi:hypothetical protein
MDVYYVGNKYEAVSIIFLFMSSTLKEMYALERWIRTDHQNVKHPGKECRDGHLSRL